MTAKKLSELASTIRSKNAGVDNISCDIVFPDRETYESVKNSRVLTRASVAHLYGIPEERISDFVEFDRTRTIKFSIYRDVPGGSPGDPDMYGSQTYVPLLDIEVPLEPR